MTDRSVAIGKQLDAVGIASGDLRRGTRRQTCPQCSSERRHKTERCLAVTVDADGAKWFCHHCGWKGCATGDEEPQPQSTRLKPEAIPSERPDDYIGPFYNSPWQNYKDAVAAAKGGFDGGDPNLLEKIARAWVDFEKATAIPGTAGEVYIRAKIPGLPDGFGFNNEVLRYEPHAWHPYLQGYHPALITKVVRARNAQFCGVQRIYLLNDGTNRLTNEQRGRLSFGRLVNGVVKLSPQRCEDGELVVVEGVVKGLAAIDCGVPGVVVATLGKDNMRGLPHLPGVTRLSIIPDNDDAGRRAAGDLVHRYHWRGTPARVVAPPWGKDLDAFLRGDQ